MINNPQANRKEVADLFWEAIPPIWYLLRARVDKIAREQFDITGGHFHVLRRIKTGDTSVSELADTRHISRPVVSRKIDSLVEKELVSRRESREDQRFTVLELTGDGEKPWN
jgi:DNA-binding MarR family transcriptional regulator